MCSDRTLGILTVAHYDDLKEHEDVQDVEARAL